MTELGEALERAFRSSDRERRVVVDAGVVHAVIRVDGGSLAIDVPRSASLPDGHKLTPARAKILRDLGFAKPTPAQDWRSVRARRGMGSAEVAGAVMDVLDRVFGVTGPVTVDVQFDDRVTPNNPSLVAAMRAVAKPPFDEALRMAMYTEMVNARFMVPLDPGDPDSEEPVAIDTLADRPVWAAFTDLDTLRMWKPRGAPWQELAGSELFPRATEAAIGSVKINPGGTVGGELYAHEVRSLSEAVRRHKARYGG